MAAESQQRVKPDRVAQVRYAHGDELAGMPGVTGIGIGKEHVIVYVSSDAVDVPAQIDDVPIIKIRNKKG